MKFVLSIRSAKRPEGFDVVARFTHAEDPIVSARAIAVQALTRNVQVWRVHRGRDAYSLFCLTCQTANDAHAIREVDDALRTHRDLEKKWKATQRADKARLNPHLAFSRKFDVDAFQSVLQRDAAFRELMYGNPSRYDEAEARAAELGIFPIPTNRVEEAVGAVAA